MESTKTDRARVEKLIRYTSALAMAGCVLVIAMSLALMVDTALRNPETGYIYLLLAMLGSGLIIVRQTILPVIRQCPPSPRRAVMMIRKLAQHAKASIAAWSLPDPDIFLFISGEGEVSKSFQPEPEKVEVSLPQTLPAPQLIPGFIYIMRRSDGVYKFGKSVNPIKRQAEHSGDYEKGFEIIRLFAVSNMTVFEQLALKMTIQYSYRKEQGRKELRRMTKRQVGAFTVEFESVIRKTVI